MRLLHRLYSYYFGILLMMSMVMTMLFSLIELVDRLLAYRHTVGTLSIMQYVAIKSMPRFVLLAPHSCWLALLVWLWWLTKNNTWSLLWLLGIDKKRLFLPFVLLISCYTALLVGGKILFCDSLDKKLFILHKTLFRSPSLQHTTHHYFVPVNFWAQFSSQTNMYHYFLSIQSYNFAQKEARDITVIATDKAYRPLQTWYCHTTQSGMIQLGTTAIPLRHQLQQLAHTVIPQSLYEAIRNGDTVSIWSHSIPFIRLLTTMILSFLLFLYGQVGILRTSLLFPAFVLIENLF